MQCGLTTQRRTYRHYCTMWKKLLSSHRGLNIRRILKITTASGIGMSCLVYMHRNEWRPSNFGVVRVGRAAFTVGVVAVDYKLSFRQLEPNTESYPSLIGKVHLRCATRLRNMCSANGGAFIKVGQHIASLDYLLPAEYVSTFKLFHSNAPQSSLDDIMTVITEDLGASPNEIFSEFQTDPIGTASLAQVHRAKLREGGEVVAVKVQHKHVKKHAYLDMKSMELLVNVMARLFPEFKFKWLVEETKRNLPRELDFVYEARNAERVAGMLKHFKFLQIPKIYWQHTTDRVLTMEYCEGGKVDDVDYIREHNLSPLHIMRCLSDLYSEMIFVRGYVHSDPHPGNVLVVPDPALGIRIVLLDHGLYASLTDTFRLNYSSLWLSLISGDVDGIREVSGELGIGPLYPLLACMLTARSWGAVTTGIDKQRSAGEELEVANQAAEYVVEITEILNSVPRQMILIFKTNDLLRALEYKLGLPNTSTSLINMSKCCVRAVYDEKLRQTSSHLQNTALNIRKHLILFKISLYQMYLYVKAYFSTLDFYLLRQSVISR